MYNLLLANYSAISNIVALVFILVFALWGLVRGFTKTFFSVFGTILGLLFAVLLSSSVANFLQEKFNFVTTVSDSLGGVLTGIFGDELMDTTLREATTEYLESQGLGSFIINIVLSVQADSTIPMDTTLNQIICPTFGYYIALIIAVIGLFIIFKLMFALISSIVKKMYANGIVMRLDKTLGLVLGLIHGVVILELVIMVISIIPIGFFQDIYAGIQTAAFANFIEDINLFKLILNSISNANIVGAIKSIISVA